ncbi:MAG TPA: VTT domain-containing protein [Candidatus Sulfotelmatobacter sp.]|jgi:uncharacterized membrane protein YdjX (TVP38/TMEM64 family)|nr:VTT domain-containing protein [Candidatus Sulfotelmatobacter sp.]
MTSAVSAGLKPRLLIKGLLTILSLAAVGWALKMSGLGDLLSEHWIDAEVRGHGVYGLLLFVGLGSGLIAIGFPRQLLCFMGGYAFGFIEGVVLASAASLIGCVLCFYYARLLGRELVMHKFAARVRRVDDFLKENPLSMTMLIRFLPVGSNLLANLVGGVSSVPAGAFFIGSLIGYLPQTVVFVLLGSGVHVDPLFRIGASVVLFVLSTVMGVVLYRRMRHGHSLDAELDQEVEVEDGE